MDGIALFDVGFPKGESTLFIDIECYDQGNMIVSDESKRLLCVPETDVIKKGGTLPDYPAVDKPDTVDYQIIKDYLEMKDKVLS